MNRLAAIFGCSALITALVLGGFSAGDDGETKTQPVPKGKAKADPAAKAPRKVVKTDEEWAKLLTREQYHVARQKGTEQPFTGKYANYHGKGTFLCVGCDEPLFDAKTKFESGTGWPSFYKPIARESVLTQPDFSDGGERIEVNCSTCGAHLGHVFDDGPRPTGLRYCINSVCLKLDTKPAETKAVEKTKPAAKAKAPAAKVKAKDAPPAEKPAAEAPAPK